MPFFIIFAPAKEAVYILDALAAAQEILKDHVMTVEKIDQGVFENIADHTLENIMSIIDEKLGGRLEAGLCGGILTLENASGERYVISKHAQNRQLWMSSPRSGASHFIYDAKAKKWMDTRGGTDLLERLSSELAGGGEAGLQLDGN